MNNDFNLLRFIDAQEDNYALALSEIKNGKKEGHWIWYVFPQILDLGSSPISRNFSIKSKEETIAYFNHPVLGKRLIEVCQSLLDIQGDSAFSIFGHPDYIKVKSCVTLFHRLIPSEPVFMKVLDKFFDGRKDDMTLMILSTL